MAETMGKDVEGLKWDEGAIYNVKWAGVRMRDVLLRAGIQAIARSELDDLHLCFASHVAPCQEDDWFGVSIPLEKALDSQGGVIIAYEMNGKPLPPEHGYPFRIVVPGYSGVRWFKWVDTITVSEKESDNFYQQKDYKVLPHCNVAVCNLMQIDTHERANSEGWWSKVPPLQANALNSVVAKIESVSQDRVRVKGYAVSGPEAQVRSVEVSINEAKTWTPAAITYQEGLWSWTLWEAIITLPQDSGEEVSVWSRAVDEKGQKQQLDVPWNLRGVGFAAVGRKTTMHPSRGSVQ